MASLVVPCKCGSKLAAPESAVGKQIRCPRCGALTTVPAMLPAEEVEVVEAKVTAPPPKSKPVRAEADDDDDDRPRKKKPRRDEEEDEAEDDRPRKKKRPRYADDDDDYDHDRTRKKPKRKSGGGGALVAGLIVGGLLLVCVGVGVAVYAFGGKKGGSVFAKRTPPPAGWEQYTYAQDGFKVYLPKGANYVTTPVDAFGPFGRGRPGRNGNWNGDVPVAERAAVISAGAGGPVQVNMYVFRFRDRVPAAFLDEFRNGRGERRIDDLHTRPITWLGYAAEEEVQAHVVTRMVLTDRLMIVAGIAGPNGSRANPDVEAAFFDNVEVTD